MDVMTIVGPLMLMVLAWIKFDLSRIEKKIDEHVINH